jgi:hypothetical protein
MILVLATSNGVVTAAAIPPKTKICVNNNCSGHKLLGEDVSIPEVTEHEGNCWSTI